MTDALLKMMKKEGGTKVIVMRHMRQLVKDKRRIAREYKMHVDPSRRLGGQLRLQSALHATLRMFRTDGYNESGKAVIDEALCAGCGLVSSICPANAIIKEAN